MSEESTQPPKPPDKRMAGIPSGTFFSDDQTGLPEGEPVNPVQAGCWTLVSLKLGCLLVLFLLLMIAGVINRLLELFK
jgi:hypothetical protein